MSLDFKTRAPLAALREFLDRHVRSPYCVRWFTRSPIDTLIIAVDTDDLVRVFVVLEDRMRALEGGNHRQRQKVRWLRRWQDFVEAELKRRGCP